MSKTAVIFPGQGAQHVGMGRDFVDAHDAARRVFAEADACLGWDLSGLCFGGPAERLNATDASQPAIFVTSVAVWRTLESVGITAELAPQALAGLSLGEYTALHVGGHVGFEDALRLVAERGRLMQLAAESSPGGMVSIMGLDEGQVALVCSEAGQGEVLTAANFNCPGQIVISGTAAACERAIEETARHGGRAVALNVAGAFHSDLMAPAARGLRQALDDAEFAAGGIPVVANVSADYHGGPDEVRDALEAQLIWPVRWQASIERLAGDGFERFVEVGPGRVLTGLMRKINRSVQTVNYSTAASLSSGAPA